MNLLAKKTGLLIMLGALFFISCKDANEILLDPGDEANKIQTSLIDTFSIGASTIVLDSFRTSTQAGLPLLLFGKYNDPYLGAVNAYSFAEVGGASATIASGSEFISFDIILDLDYQIGDKAANQEINIYQLADTINRVPYRNNDYVFQSPGPSANEQKINETGTFNHSNSLHGKITLRLNDDLGKSIFNLIQADSDTFQNQENFRKFFKGVQINGGENNTAAFGALISDSSKIVLTYRKDTVISTINFPFVFNVNHIDRPLIPSLTNTAIVQSSTGVLGQVSFPSVKALRQYKDRIAINKAELIIKPEVDQGISPPSNLFLLLKKDTIYRTYDQQRVYSSSLITHKNYKSVQSTIIGDFQGVDFNSSALSVSYEGEKNQYVADITSYIEAIIKNNDDYYTTDLVLYPEAQGHMVNNFYSYSINSSSIVGFNKDLTINRAVIQNQKIKLKIYYTLVD